MAENSKIEWTDHTFNPWTGCTKVGPACDNCYAEGWAKRSGHVEWGAHGARRRTRTWGDPVKWDRQAEADGVRRKVFCASLADVFDNHRSIAPEWRRDLWQLIEETPHLDWLLLTKRPQNFAKLAPARWIHDGCPPHVWLGTTVENQTEADRRIPHLLSIPARVRFLSCEPLLGPVDLTEIGIPKPELRATKVIDALRGWGGAPGKLHWMICGGESGPGARPMNPEWARSLRDQCADAGVPFHFKQWGDHDHHGRRVGKKRAGRTLDGVTHDGFPTP